jgi:hypothetical protein
MDPAALANFAKEPMIQLNLKSAKQGAATTVLAAIGREHEGVEEKCLEHAGEWGPVGYNVDGYEPGYAAWAFNSELEDRLWKDYSRFVGIKDG